MLATDVAEFLVVAVDDRRFALPAPVVQTAVAPPPVTPLPFVPAHVEGLVNVNERVLPVINLRLLFGTPQPAAVSEIVVVDTVHAPFAVRVDAVMAKVDLPVDAIEPLAADNADDGTAGGAPVTARFAWNDGTVLVLAPDALARLVCAREAADGRRGLLGRFQAGSESAAAGTAACVVVRVGAELYGIALADTIEILDLPPATAIPGAPVAAEGVTLIRDEALLVLSLARLLRREDGATASGSVVVIDRDGIHYGLRVDSVEGILSYPADRLRAIEDDASEVSGIVIDGERVLGLLQAGRLLPAARHAALAAFAPARRMATDIGAERRVAILEVMLGDEAYGIPLERVRRITDAATAEQVRGESGSLVSGAVNIDGNVVPVVDFRALLQLDETLTGRGAWVIVGDTGSEWAIPVGKASDIVEIPESAIEPVSEQGRLVTAIARIDQRLVSLLSMSPLQPNA